MDKEYEHLKKLVTPSELALIEGVSLFWANRCGHNLREQVYGDLVEIIKSARGID